MRPFGNTGDAPLRSTRMDYNPMEESVYADKPYRGEILTANRSIPQRLDSIQMAISNLEEGLLQLLGRIEPIMRASVPSPAERPKQVEPNCDLDSRLYSIEERINSIHQTVEDRVSRLEI